MKIAIIGCGLRTPLLIHGLAHSDLDTARVVLYDTVPGRSDLMAALGRAIAAETPLQIMTSASFQDAVESCSFVISSIRPGDMKSRARDERVTLECGFAGQETTGPAGFAMALRTVPIAVEYARIVERTAPDAWIVNFTNPAGLITQAISVHSSVRVVGICDTPAELFFRISLALQKPLEEIECDYIGLNHLGWVKAVNIRGNDGRTEDVTDRLLEDERLLRSLYPAELFPPELIRTIRLIPTEYVYFYYRQQAARANQLRAGATRGEELQTLNQAVFEELESNVRKSDLPGALAAYRAYLNRRNASYMHLEGAGTSAFSEAEVDWNPFEGATGYHRIAVDAIRGLTLSKPVRMVLNIVNNGAIQELAREDVVEVPCWVDRSGPRAAASTGLPEIVRGLTISVKTYERLAIESAMNPDKSAAIGALFANPIIADWERARDCVEKMLGNIPDRATRSWTC